MRPLAILSVVAALPGLAQVQWGGLRGVISDPSWSPDSWRVHRGHQQHGAAWITTFSDERGSYALPALPVGSYTITVSAPGFHTLLYHQLEIRLGIQLTFNARMSLGSVADSIDVNEPLPPADMTSSQTATQINANAFEASARAELSTRS